MDEDEVLPVARNKAGFSEILQGGLELERSGLEEIILPVSRNKAGLFGTFPVGSGLESASGTIFCQEHE